MQSGGFGRRGDGGCSSRCGATCKFSFTGFRSSVETEVLMRGITIQNQPKDLVGHCLLAVYNFEARQNYLRPVRWLDE